ncbi:MAG: phosphoadenylyl-sulfate reductase [Anaerolineales bacterium]|nr:phosphoadenylyl-sulfate reductase [Anaerolineales bacterium]
MIFSKEQIRQQSKSFESSSPQEILSWAIDTLAPEITMSTSFQTQSMPLLHMAIRIKPDLPIQFLDTGFHFWETLIFRERMQMAWKLNLIDLYRDSRWDNFCRQFGRELPRQDPNLCCYIHKVQPMQKGIQGYRGWISGIRRDQTEERARAEILEQQPDGLLKVNPMLNWTSNDIQAYIREYNLPAHPLYEQGYRSIGCSPCTRPVSQDELDRAGRWDGRGKTECGLHTSMFTHKELQELSGNFVLNPLDNESTN